MRLSAFALVLACAVLAACGRDADERGSDASGEFAGDGLPTPAGRPGSSVTGMPTDPPPQVAADVAPAPIPGPALPADGAPPGDPGAIPIDPATGLAASAVAAADTASDAGISAAGNVVREYMTLLSSGAFAGAQRLWSATPTDSAILQAARGQAFAVEVMAPARNADPAAEDVVTVPVRVRGSGAEGDRLLSATYTVRRSAEGAWRIASANVREESP